jgi:hypothetical protein
MRASKITRKGNRFSIERTETKEVDEKGLREYREYVLADMAECQKQKQRLAEWEKTLQEELAQIDALLT